MRVDAVFSTLPSGLLVSWRIGLCGCLAAQTKYRGTPAGRVRYVGDVSRRSMRRL